MAWVTPRTFVVGAILTAAQLNEIRDSLNETTPAKVTTKGDLTPATGANAMARLGIGASGTVLTSNGACAGGMAWGAPVIAAPLFYNNATCRNFTGQDFLVDVEGMSGASFNSLDGHRILVSVWGAGRATDHTQALYVTVNAGSADLFPFGKNVFAINTGTLDSEQAFGFVFLTQGSYSGSTVVKPRYRGSATPASISYLAFQAMAFQA